jgi:hypothetical protein
MIQEMSDVEEQKIQAIAVHGVFQSRHFELFPILPLSIAAVSRYIAK